eukprot:CAMPEP_0114992152 /NCGR_PEP_ID=MMETSP0216-20121206/11777_1 /TAXON_ID=223996 /ORGANISM="Protocruzia adherens, Strain Boccale" /LENGTH=543 /DNA_ID=CAMNT_0002355575 /DNA_START=85 /DNA_END=1716 /DNA_ORIENTATION=-
MEVDEDHSKDDNSHLDQATIDEILQKADTLDDQDLDENYLEKNSQTLEKRVAKNEEMRAKFPTQPDKFMDSEIKLDEIIQKFQALATRPDLFPKFISLAITPTFMTLLGHENTDIISEVVDFLKDITDPELEEEAEDEVNQLVDHLIKSQLFESIIQALDKLDESSSSDSQTVHSCLNVVENVLELNSDASTVICDRTRILSWLLKRLSTKFHKNFDDNKLYASEILASLMQGNERNQHSLGQLGGIEPLLSVLALYRKKEPASQEELEMGSNVFDVICNVLLDTDNQDLFIHAEGLELMIRLMRDQKKYRHMALKVADFATSHNISGCKRMIEVQGLKTVFAIFMKKGLSKIKGEKKELQLTEEHTLSIIHSLCRYSSGINLDRVINKFKENNFEKLERLIELRAFYDSKISKVDDQTRAQKYAGEELEEDELEQRILLDKLEDGLFTLQIIDKIIAFLYTCDDDEVLKTLHLLTNIQGIEKNAIISTLQNLVDNLGDEIGEDQSEGEEDKQRSQKTTRAEKEYHTNLISKLMVAHKSSETS